MAAASAMTRRASAERFWRLVASGSLAALFAGTHWPSLRIPEFVGPDGETSPFHPDKFLHFIGFGLLLVPWWWSGWFRRRSVLLAAAAAWAVFDEAMQAVLPIDRTFLAEDALSNLCGIAAAASVLAAAGPVGRGDGSSALAMHARSLAEDQLLGRPSNWMLLAVSVALAVLVASPLLALLGPSLGMHPQVMAIGGGALAAAAGGLVALDRGIAAKLKQLRGSCGCLGCGRPRAAGVCSACGAATPPGAWGEGAKPTAAAVLRAAWWPLLRSAAAVGGLVGLFLLLVADRPWALSEAIDRRYLALNPATRIVIDLAMLIAAGSWAAHGIRRRLAEAADRQHLRCLRCGHDLAGTPADAAAGTGRCGECGTPFVAAAAVAGEAVRRDDAVPQP